MKIKLAAGGSKNIFSFYIQYTKLKVILDKQIISKLSFIKLLLLQLVVTPDIADGLHLVLLLGIYSTQ